MESHKGTQIVNCSDVQSVSREPPEITPQYLFDATLCWHQSRFGRGFFWSNVHLQTPRGLTSIQIAIYYSRILAPWLRIQSEALEMCVCSFSTFLFSTSGSKTLRRADPLSTVLPKNAGNKIYRMEERCAWPHYTVVHTDRPIYVAAVSWEVTCT